MGKKQRMKQIRREERAKLKTTGQKKQSLALIIGSIAVVAILVSAYVYFAYQKTASNRKGRVAVVETNKGKIKIRFLEEDAPITVANFIKLSKQDFFNDLKFHRVEKGKLIQGGDPNSKNDDLADDGQGGPGYQIPTEIELDNKENPKNKNVKGAVGMAKSQGDINSNASQFYILLADEPQFDGGYTVFGEVIEGLSVAKKIKKGDAIKKITIEGKVTLD